MYLNEKDLALNQILKNLELLEEEISSIITSYYIERPLNINGMIIKMSIYDLIQGIIHDYKNIVLKDFYEEFD